MIIDDEVSFQVDDLIIHDSLILRKIDKAETP